MASAAPSTLVKKKLTIDNVSWTAIQPPINCASLRVANLGGVDVKIRTDSGDANTEHAVPSGAEENWVAEQNGSTPRFLANQTVAFAQAVSGTGPLLLTGMA